MKHLLLAFCFLASTLPLRGQAPSTFGYQGFLTDAQSQPLNGTVSLTFSLYTALDAPTPVWTETHASVEIDQGAFGVTLGAITPFRQSPPAPSGPGYLFGTSLYLGLRLGSDPEMTPRVPLTSVPSALTMTTPAYLTLDDDVRFVYPLTVVSEGRAPAVFASGIDGGLRARASGTTDGVAALYGYTSSATGYTLGVFGETSSPDGLGGMFNANAPEGGTGVGGASTFGTGVGGFSAGESGETYGVSGVALSPDGTGVRGSGAVGVFAEGDPALIAKGFNTGIDVSATTTGVRAVARDVAVWAIDSAETSGTIGVYSQTFSDGGLGIYARAHAPTGTTNAIYGRTDSPDGRGVTGIATATSGTNYGVRGLTNSSSGYGVLARAASTEGVSYGVWGENHSTSGTGVAGVALATSGSPFGLYGRSDAPSGYAGYFDGNVHVSDAHSAAASGFAIDHPADPANKTLNHSFAAAPEMMTIYSGNVVLQTGGETTVTLPDWFESLNEDFRYQLTPIGGPAPNLYVAQKVSGNQFQIAGGTQGLEVSWQVTAVRRDAWALANPIQVEEDKAASGGSAILQPEAFGLPAAARAGSRATSVLPAESETDLLDLERTPPAAPSRSKIDVDRLLEMHERIERSGVRE